MEINNSVEVGEHFDKNWERYLRSIHNNFLYHQEMFSMFDKFLKEHFDNKPFALADMGCGDGSVILGALMNKPITQYIGVDAAADLMHKAPQVLDSLTCDKQFICGDMAQVIKTLPTLDIIFCSYALHHLSHESKVAFILDCKNKLADNGFLILVDGVLAQNQTRDEWLAALEKRYFEATPNHTEDELASFRKHVHNDDFPEAIDTYRQIAESQHWGNFEVLIDKGIFAFMVFSKHHQTNASRACVEIFQ
jgi:SAM-dependent methyltransferase